MFPHPPPHPQGKFVQPHHKLNALHLYTGLVFTGNRLIGTFVLSSGKSQLMTLTLVDR